MRVEGTGICDRLRAVGAAFEADGVAVPPLEGKLLRPALALALVPPPLRSALDDGFWAGALAIQMVHEASLLHDDILDEAETRRGTGTVVARQGVGPALVLGDRYLTGAYRAAAGAGDAAFLRVFIEAVERTVAGEVAQERARGRALSEADYRRVIRGKSGELFGAAAVLAAARCGAGTEAARALGCGAGALYQMVDDFLDYCPRAATGKEPFQDYRQRKYTFVLREAGVADFTRPTEAVHRALFTPGAGGRSAMERALERLRMERDRLTARGEVVFGHESGFAVLLAAWVAAAEAGFRVEVEAWSEAAEVRNGVATRPGGVAAARATEPSGERRRRRGPVGHAPAPEAWVADAARALGGPEAWAAYFGRHSKSFRFASLLLPSGPRADVQGVYAFCRFTDDLVDEAGAASGAVMRRAHAAALSDAAVRPPDPEVRARLEAWGELCQAAYQGTRTGVPLLDTVLGRMRAEGVPFQYVGDLLAGVAMDLEPTTYPTWAELEVYTYRVASVVG
ncbi:MAG: polyprenyl synthetase family protein, partial [Longimicrobiales bacterium]|nr:polyprenyl synthetase family protein [Longimicrobiales bacterium]